MFLYVLYLEKSGPRERIFSNADKCFESGIECLLLTRRMPHIAKYLVNKKALAGLFA
jgi:hypothetical protein